jgi:hypothetical protein
MNWMPQKRLLPARFQASAESAVRQTLDPKQSLPVWPLVSGGRGVMGKISAKLRQ